MYSFRIYRNLLHINIHNCDIPNNVLTKTMFSKLSEVQSLFLQNNSISLIESNTFNDMHKVMFIDLTGNNLHTIQEHSFLGLQAVPLLDLSSLHIKTIGSRCFIGLLQLATLNLSSNQITSLKTHTFSGMRSIQILDIRDNRIEFIDHHTFMFNDEVLVHVSELIYCCYLSTRASCHTHSKQANQPKDLLTIRTTIKTTLHKRAVVSVLI